MLYILNLYKCLDFFGLKIDRSPLHKVRVSSENNFDLVLDVVDLIGYDHETINLLLKHLPHEYDLSTVSKELLNEMLKCSMLYKILYNNNEQ